MRVGGERGRRVRGCEGGGARGGMRARGERGHEGTG